MVTHAFQPSTRELTNMASMQRKASVFVRAAALGVLVALTACDTLRNPLDVEPASRIPAEQIETSGNAQILLDGAIADFECAFGSYVAQGGTIGEEFIYAEQTAARAPYDRRSTTPDDFIYATSSCAGLGVYTPLQTARGSADNLLTRLKGWTDAEVSAGAGSPNRSALIAVAAAYAGYSYVLIGEGFCTAAISTINPDRSINYGGEIQRDSVFRIAVARFTEASAATAAAPASANNTSIRNMALLGRARAKLFLADYAGAKADANQVPSEFLRLVTASDASARRQNRIAAENSAAITSLSVGDLYRNLGDTRVPVLPRVPARVSATGITHFYQTKYPSTATPFPLATYEEAQPIVAEADIRAGSLATALPILNASRARGGQSAFTGTTQPQYLAELIDQRRRELFAEGQHLGDIIRFNIALQPAAGSAYHFGGNYGNQVCLPLPAAERLNNPLIGA